MARGVSWKHFQKITIHKITITEISSLQCSVCQFDKKNDTLWYIGVHLWYTYFWIFSENTNPNIVIFPFPLYPDGVMFRGCKDVSHPLWQCCISYYSFSYIFSVIHTSSWAYRLIFLLLLICCFFFWLKSTHLCMSLFMSSFIKRQPRIKERGHRFSSPISCLSQLLFIEMKPREKSCCLLVNGGFLKDFQRLKGDLLCFICLFVPFLQCYTACCAGERGQELRQCVSHRRRIDCGPYGRVHTNL